MKKVFLDTNVLIDYLARREQFFQPAAQIVQLGQDYQCQLLVSALSFATASFILHMSSALQALALVPREKVTCDSQPLAHMRRQRRL